MAVMGEAETSANSSCKPWREGPGSSGFPHRGRAAHQGPGLSGSSPREAAQASKEAAQGRWVGITQQGHPTRRPGELTSGSPLRLGIMTLDS